MRRLADREVFKIVEEKRMIELDHFAPPNAQFVFVVRIESSCIEHHRLSCVEVGGGVAFPQITMHETRLDRSALFGERI